nr:carboxymuconolactone decarboxylase family protein [Paraburkholderia panacisoli]
MAPGALDPLIKELLYVAVSVTNNCGYCVASHGRRAPRGHDRRDVRRADGSNRGRRTGKDTSPDRAPPREGCATATPGLRKNLA